MPCLIIFFIFSLFPLNIENWCQRFFLFPPNTCSRGSFLSSSGNWIIHSSSWFLCSVWEKQFQRIWTTVVPCAPGCSSSGEQTLLSLPALPASIPQHPLLLTLGCGTARLLRKAAVRGALESWGKPVSGKENELWNKEQKYSWKRKQNFYLRDCK